MKELVDLPPNIKHRLVAALESGMLTAPYSETAIASVVGAGAIVGSVLAGLARLEGLEIGGPAAAAWIRTVDEASSALPIPDLVWSGPEVPGLHARDTRRVYEELVENSEKSIWVSTYAFFEGREAFKTMAFRMQGRPELKLTLLVNIARRSGDTSSAEELVRRFADRFWNREWPGDSRPSVFYDPRSLAPDGPGGVLHAKAMVADEEALFITSANLTEAALDRNIEMGILIRDRPMALAAVAHFQGLIDRQLLNPLPTP